MGDRFPQGYFFIRSIYSNLVFDVAGNSQEVCVPTETIADVHFIRIRKFPRSLVVTSFSGDASLGGTTTNFGNTKKAT